MQNYADALSAKGYRSFGFDTDMEMEFDLNNGHDLKTKSGKYNSLKFFICIHLLKIKESSCTEIAYADKWTKKYTKNRQTRQLKTHNMLKILSLRNIFVSRLRWQ